MKYIAKPREVEAYLHEGWIGVTSKLPDDAPQWLKDICPSFCEEGFYYVKEKEDSLLPIVSRLTKEQFQRQFETLEQAESRRILDVNLALLGEEK